MGEHAELEHSEIIGGADGPTAIFIADRTQNPTISQKLQRFFNKTKRRFIEKRIVPGTHTVEEVGEYLKSRYGFIEVPSTNPGLAEEYEQMRTSFLFEHRPDLVGEQEIDFDIDPSENREETLRRLEEKIYKEREIAKSIPMEVFDIDYHRYTKTGKNINDSMDIIIERNYAYFGGGAQGSKGYIKKWNKIYKDVYRYYGVSEQDIQNRTQRYKNLIFELSM